jgi:tyrosinase
MLDPENRMNVLPANTPANDTVDLKWTAKVAQTWDLVNNIGGSNGDFCYIYV